MLVMAALWATDPAVSPASEAAIDSFIAALPPTNPKPGPGGAFDQERLERLLQLNPGRETDVRAAFNANEQCEATAKRKAVRDVVRSTARRLGEEKLERLTAFYSGPDYPVFARLSTSDSDRLSQGDKSELGRIMAAYPLEEYSALAREMEESMWLPEGFAGELLKCWEAYEAELERRTLTR